MTCMVWSSHVFRGRVTTRGTPMGSTRPVPTDTRFDALTSDIEVDLAGVGAGIAGISAACELAHSGRSVAVLESHRVGSGVTGHTAPKAR